MKLGCKEKHWKIKEGQLVLDTPQGQDVVKDMIKVLEQQIRLNIYNEICAIDLTADRKKIMKYGLENALLQVQDICATIALGNKDANI